jgi:hypothetical protein
VGADPDVAVGSGVAVGGFGVALAPGSFRVADGVMGVKVADTGRGLMLGPGVDEGVLDPSLLNSPSIVSVRTVGSTVSEGEGFSSPVLYSSFSAV